MATPTGNGSTPTLTPAQTPSEPDQQQKQNLSKVLNSIQQSLGLLHQLHLTVSSFNMASQLPLLQRLNDVVLELEMLQKLADSCNIQVPMEVVNLIDDGKNPDEFTRDVINSCIARNQVTKGKTDAFKVSRWRMFFNGKIESRCSAKILGKVKEPPEAPTRGTRTSIS